MTDPTYDTPSEEDVHQIDEESLDTRVKVIVDNVVRTDEMPTELTSSRNIIMPAAQRAEQILNYDPRRKLAIVWCFAIGAGTDIDGLCVAPSESEANGFAGAILHSGTGLLRYEWTFKTALWARPAEYIDASLSIAAPATGALVVSVMNEQWAN